MLVSPTVVEVGVDVPGATVWWCCPLTSARLAPTRLGRGRNSFLPVSYMVSDSQDENARARLQSLVDHPVGLMCSSRFEEVKRPCVRDDLCMVGLIFMFATLDSDISRA